MSGRHKSSTLKFHNFNIDEKSGYCKLLEKEGNDLSLCSADTFKPEYHYCYDCYEVIKYSFGSSETRVWPPVRDGSESRYCYDYKTENCFLIPTNWIENYSNPDQAEKYSSFSGGIDVKTQPFQSKKGGTYPCYVYLFRMKDNVIYVGETKDYKIRLEQHQNSPGVEVIKHDGFKEEIYHVKVENRVLAEKLEQLLVNILNGANFPATNGKKLH